MIDRRVAEQRKPMRAAAVTVTAYEPARSHRVGRNIRNQSAGAPNVVR